jgi:hypothetical protein
MTLKRRLTCAGAIAVLVTLTGCGSSDNSPADCLAREPSISTGVYGCVTETNDVGTDRSAHVFPGFEVQVFADEPPPTPSDGLEPLATAKTDSLGFYQMALDPGNYSLCTAFRRCTAIHLAADAPSRKNYEFGLSMGW